MTLSGRNLTKCATSRRKILTVWDIGNVCYCLILTTKIWKWLVASDAVQYVPPYKSNYEDPSEKKFTAPPPRLAFHGH